MKTRFNPLKDKSPYTYEVKGWNEKSKPKQTKTHPWRKRNDTLKNYSIKALLKLKAEKL
jgi:hypothetical protein